MKLEALQGFLRVNPQNTVNDVSLQGKAKRQGNVDMQGIRTKTDDDKR